jgi:hypothetical protein
MKSSLILLLLLTATLAFAESDVEFEYELTEKTEFGLRYIKKFVAQQHSRGFEGGFVFSF